jgi:hypothetical protein
MARQVAVNHPFPEHGRFDPYPSHCTVTVMA